MAFLNTVLPESPTLVVYASFGVTEAKYSRRRTRRHKLRK